MERPYLILKTLCLTVLARNSYATLFFLSLNKFHTHMLTFSNSIEEDNRLNLDNLWVTSHGDFHVRATLKVRLALSFCMPLIFRERMYVCMYVCMYV